MLLYMNTANDFRVAQASWLDLFPLHQLEHACFQADAWPLIELLAVLTFPGVVRLKVVVDQRMAGFIAADKSFKHGEAWILTLGVLPEYRRLGIATLLLTECEKEIGYHAPIKLSVRASNLPAIRLYQQHGYCQVDVWKNYYRDGEDGWVFEKNYKIKGG